MKKIIAIAAGAVIVVGVTLIFVSRNNGFSVGVSQGDLTSEQKPDHVAGGVMAADVPSGDTMFLGTRTGSITVKNFYKSAVGIIEDLEVVLVKHDGYKIDYARADSSFVITVKKAPLDATRATAEAEFLNLLGVSKSDACRLAVKIVVYAGVDKNTAEQGYPLSFCGGTPAPR